MAIVNYFEYTTMQGDTFDMLALDAYNDEFKAHLIIQANPQYAGVLVFDAGIKLKIPIIEQEAAATLPPWKR
ncbi:MULTISPECIES: tail protein X [Clostridia]|uniref:LysM domain-containing protein n=2 Tax=Clostridia TaxID=186801 RepID=A0A5D8QEQ8_9THEO|nr:MULTISPECIES: tail protein X [Clostridia]AYO30257.1 LysM domain-containing protein [Biomaibacter acetigenes]TZE82003.1 LysM domain-containing protein [Calorimonas adulescens]